MTEPHTASPQPGDDHAKPWVARLRPMTVVFALATLVVVISDFQDLGERIHTALSRYDSAVSARAAALNAAAWPSMFAMGEEISARYEACDYRWLVVCVDKASEPPAQPLCNQPTPLGRADCIFGRQGQGR